MAAVTAAPRSSRWVSSVVFAITLAASVISASSLARAQGSQGLPGATVSAFGTLGWLGGVQYDGVSTADKLGTSYGFGAQVSYPLHRYFALGLLGRYMRWHSQMDTQGSGFIETAVTPRGQYQLALAGMPLTLFLQVPVGIAVVDREWKAARDASVEWTNSPAFVFGVSAGAELFFSQRFGAFIELGWLHHAFDVDLKGKDTRGTAITADAGYQTDQPILQLGIIFALTEL